MAISVALLLGVTAVAIMWGNVLNCLAVNGGIVRFSVSLIVPIDTEYVILGSKAEEKPIFRFLESTQDLVTFDKVEPVKDFIQIDENTIEVTADKEIDDLNEDYDLNIPNEDFQTIGGYVFGLIGREPEINDVIEDKTVSNSSLILKYQ